MIFLQEIFTKLSQFWEAKGCIIHQGYDLEVGAGTFNPATFLRCLGKEPYRAAYVEPCRRPSDGRYGENPNRLQHFFQYQVILKPSPLNMQDIYIDSLKAIGIDLKKHDLRFIHDDWENPTIGASGLGWEVWIDGMEITQYTYFQTVGGLPVKPVTGELSYGIERLGMYLQNVDTVYDLKWNHHLTYGDIYKANEVEWSRYNFEEADSPMWSRHFNDFEREALRLITKGLPIPAYQFVMKASHAFNILDARGAISVSERTNYISRIRQLAEQIARAYVESRKAKGYPLLHQFLQDVESEPKIPPLSKALIDADPENKASFLLEIGSEELPAAFVPVGQRNLERDFKQLLGKLQLPYDSIEVFGTPRRLALLIKGLPLGILAKKEQRKGPALERAYDDQGHLTEAGKGFFRSVDLPFLSLDALKAGEQGALKVKKIKDRDYLFATLEKPQFSTAKALQSALPDLILDLDFPKKMRWADLEITYARPIRWIVALFGEEVIPFQVGRTLSDKISLGHRQLDPAAFPIPTADAYQSIMIQHKVMPAPKEREELIEKELGKMEKALNVQIIEKANVLSKVIYLVEWPCVMEGSFDINYLKAPKEVIIKEMVEHQKYFPVAKKNGELSPHFIFAADTLPNDQIRKGNEKVLSSRLADGVFLFEKGLKVPFEVYNEKLRSVTFLSGMGSVYDKVLRLMGHIEILQKALKIGTADQAIRAAELSKADLACEMVFEFPELQGVIGRYYALHHGESEQVAKALEEQWMPRGERDALPTTETGTLLSLADKFDNLICCFALGEKPTSSGDPHALRRQALGIIKILIGKKLSLSFRDILEGFCHNFIPSQLKNKNLVIQEITDFFINRIKTVFLDYNLKRGEIEASLASGFRDIYDTFSRVHALHRFRETGEKFDKLYEVFKRAKGQVNAHKAQVFSEDLLLEEAEKGLYASLKQSQDTLALAMQKQSYDEAYELISNLQPDLARLFDEVRILAEDPKLQNNRIALLQKVLSLFSQLLDFNKL